MQSLQFLLERVAVLQCKVVAAIGLIECPHPDYLSYTTEAIAQLPRFEHFAEQAQIELDEAYPLYGPEELDPEVADAMNNHGQYTLEKLLAIVAEASVDYQMAIDDCVYDEYDVERLNSTGEEYFYFVDMLDSHYPLISCNRPPEPDEIPF